MSDYSKLTDYEIDCLIAKRFMGWSFKDYYNGGGEWRDSSGKKLFHKAALPKYATDYTAVVSVRSEIDRLAEKNHAIELGYRLRLMEIVRRDVQKNDWRPLDWLMLNATPRQQCEAALLMLEE